MKSNLNLNDRVNPQPGMELIPDGTVEVRKSNKQNFEYKMSINDKMYYSYHRNNGITKMGIVDKSEKSTNTLFSDEGFT
jgi:hypothetical protein